MAKQPEVPEQLTAVIAELNKNWNISPKAIIEPVWEETEYWSDWYLKVTIRDYSFRFPWNDEVTLVTISEIHGYLFRMTCMAVQAALLHGMRVGSQISRDSFIKGISSLLDNDIRKTLHTYERGFL